MIKLVSGFIVLGLLIIICFCSRYDPGMRAARNHNSGDNESETERDTTSPELSDVEAPTPSVVKCWECPPHDDNLTVGTSVDHSGSTERDEESELGGSSTLWQSIRSSLKRRRSTLKMGNIRRRSILEEPRSSSINLGDLGSTNV